MDSTIDIDDILAFFDKEDIKYLNSYIMFKNNSTPQNSKIYKKEKEIRDTNDRKRK